MVDRKPAYTSDLTPLPRQFNPEDGSSVSIWNPYIRQQGYVMQQLSSVAPTPWAHALQEQANAGTRQWAH
jgi:hypothetical protein